MKLTASHIIDELTNFSPEILNYLEYQLEVWAKWYRQNDQHGLGFSPVTIEYRMMKFGCLPNEKGNSKPLPSNDIAEEMEAVVCIMATQGGNNMRSAAALREFYLGQGRGNQIKTAKAMGVSRRNLQEYLRGAYSWLAGWFTREYASRLIHIAKIN